MANRVFDLRPPYPVYDATPLFGGELPSIDAIGPPDLRPSSLNPFYSVYAASYGRNFAGLGQVNEMDVQTTSADEGIADYPNELTVLAEADDVVGNGVFDPHGSPGNIHPDEGIFADKENLPGYVFRDQFYAPSEVVDGTTGNPVVYVPSGAVAIDQAQADTFRERQLMMALQPGISPQYFGAPAGGDIWIPRDYAMPVAGLGRRSVGQDVTEPTGTSRAGLFAGFAIAGVAIGLMAAVLTTKRR
jgi:hypothetical protein